MLGCELEGSEVTEQSSSIVVARGASYLSLQLIVSALGRIVTFAYIVRIITVANVGLLTVLLTALAGIQTIINLGLGKVVTKIIAEKVAKGKVREAAASVYLSLALNTALSLLAACVVFVSGFPAGVSNLPNTKEVYAISILFSLDVIFNLFPITSDSMVGLQKFKAFALISMGYSTSRMVLSVVLVSLTRSLVGLVAAWMISDVVETLVAIAYLMKHLGGPIFDFSTKYLLKLSIPLLLGNLSIYTYQWFDRLILIGRVNLATLGVYGAATQAFDSYNNLIGILPTVLLPVFAKTHGASGPENLHKVVKAASRYIAYISIPTAFGLSAMARPAITLLVGQSYEGAAIPLAILAAFSTAIILASALTPVFIVLNETVLAALPMILPVPVSVAIGLLSVQYFGLVGVAVARGIAFVLYLILTILFLRRKFPVAIQWEPILKSVGASLVMAAVVWLMQLEWYSRFLLPIYALVGFMTYLICLRAMRAVNPADIDLLDKLLGLRFRLLVKTLSRILVAT